MSLKSKLTHADRLDFLRSHLRELRDLAAADNLQLTSYFIEMAYIEISDRIREERPFDAKKRHPDLTAAQ